MSRSTACATALLLAASITLPTAGSPARGADLFAEPQPAPEVVLPPKPFRFATGLRYWYSWGKTSFGFSNGNPRFGDPTSTLEWKDTSHSGEVFAKLDHEPSGTFLRGSLGLGAITSGTLADRDFMVGQIKFSDTTSSVSDNSLGYGMADIGVEFMPYERVKIGPFVGYHYWKQNLLAMGARCNGDDVQNVLCPYGLYTVGPGAKAIGYDTVWNAARLGLSGGYWLGDGLTVSGEVAWVPYARYSNADSHFQRTDLGPVPNIVSSGHGMGVEAQSFINYALTQSFDIGFGVRYWGLFTSNGSTRFKVQPGAFQGTDFDTERVGFLAQAKYRF